jgi:GT2 family glycosyltransferase
MAKSLAESVDPGVTVLLPIYNGFESVRSCLASLVDGGIDPSISKLILVDDASTDIRIKSLLVSYKVDYPCQIVLIENPVNLGYLRSVNASLANISGPVILLNSDTIVCPDWATRLVRGARRYSRLGMLTPLSNNATFSTVQLPFDLGSDVELENLPVIHEWVASRLGAPYPLAPTGMGFCLLITELARSLVEGFDELFSPGYEEENDMAQKLRSYGLQCRIATDVFVYHKGGDSFGALKNGLQQHHYRLIQSRHPSYDSMIREWFYRLDYPFSLTGSVDRRSIKVLLDCEVMRQSMTGVVRYILTLLDCFEPYAKSGRFEITALLTDQKTRDFWKNQYPWVKWILESELDPIDLYPGYDIYHLVNANISIDRVLVMRRYASRLVITLHDLIAYENPSYFESGPEYVAYRHRLRLLVALSDVVLTISSQTLSDVVEQLELPERRCKLFPNPLLHLKPTSLPCSADESQYCLIVGTDFRHKHVPVTLEIFRDLVLPIRPGMRLRIAGPRVESGGTSHVIQAMLREDRELAAAVEILGPVSDERLYDLYQGAAFCFYLSLHEGFGYIPYEAAVYGCPTLVANTSVYSGCPESVAVPPFDCPQTKQALTNFLLDSSARQANLDFWLNRIYSDHQRDPGAELFEIYQDVLGAPRNYVSETLADVVASPVDGANSILAQSDLKRAVRSLSRRVLLAARRKARARLQRLTSGKSP